MITDKGSLISVIPKGPLWIHSYMRKSLFDWAAAE